MHKILVVKPISRQLNCYSAPTPAAYNTPTLIKKHIFTLTGQCTACSALQVLYFFEYKPPSKCRSVTPIKLTRVTSRSGPLFQSVRVRLRFASTQIIRFSSGSLFAILKNTVQVRLRYDKISVKPVYKTQVRVRFNSLFSNV